MEDGYMKTWQECCDHFAVNPEHGLTTDQVKKNRDKYGPNGKNYFKKSLKSLSWRKTKRVNSFRVLNEPIVYTNSDVNSKNEIASIYETFQSIRH